MTSLRADRVVTCGPDGVIVGGQVSFDGTRIDSVTATAAASDPTALDYGDATILPGIVDAHAHLTLFGDGRSYEQMMREPNDLMVLVGLRNLQRHLAAGVTTIRDNGARDRTAFHLRDSILRGYFDGPRLLLSGRPITHSAGHFHFCNEIADGVDGVRRSIRRLVAEGADHIKIMASGGDTAGNQPFHPSYTVQELRAAVETAHELGRLTTAHCRSRRSMEYAVEAGLDCIEHGEFLVPGGTPPLGTGTIGVGVMEYDVVLARRILDSSTYVSFTPQAGGYDTLVRLRSTGVRGVRKDDDERRFDELERYYEVKLGILSRLIQDGLLPKLAISTDAGCFDSEFGYPRYGAELGVAAGMMPEQAIRAVTQVAAQVCGLGDLIGSLEVGKEADVVVVRGNPLTDIGALQDVIAVYRGGRRLVGRDPAFAGPTIEAAVVPH